MPRQAERIWPIWSDFAFFEFMPLEAAAVPPAAAEPLKEAAHLRARSQPRRRSRHQRIAAATPVEIRPQPPRR